jgi:predicted MPP superfamily phosphohydrolase
MRYFLQKMLVLALLPTLLGAATFKGRVFLDQNRNGRLDEGEKGLAGILLSDGHAVVTSDAEGHFSIDCAEDKPLLWYCRPSDHEPIGEFWRWGVADAANDFALASAPQQRDFNIVQFTDSHLTVWQIPVMKNFIEHLAALPLSFAFAINTGDLVGSSDTLPVDKALEQYDAYTQAIAERSFPLFHVIGNHEHVMSTYAERDMSHEFYGKGLYRQRFGPNYYSFDWAGVHFYALDGTQLHQGLGYREALGEEQLAWLEKDLAQIQAGTPIVIFIHEAPASIPGHSSGIRDRAQLAKLLQGHNLQAAFCGHLHNNYESKLNDAPLFVSGALSGAWWGGPNSDGSPQGYRLISIKDGVFQRTAYFNREGRNAIARIAPSAGIIGSGQQTITLSVLDYGKPVELTATRRPDNMALTPVLSRQEPLWSFWTVSFDSSTWPDNLYTFDFKALQDGQESKSSTRCLLINDQDDPSFQAKYDYVLHFTYVRSDADAELLFNEQVIASINKGHPCGRSERGSIPIPQKLLRRMNSLSIRPAPGQKGRVAISHVSIKFQRENKKTTTISDPRYYGHSALSVNAEKPQSAGKRYFAIPD